MNVNRAYAVPRYSMEAHDYHLDTERGPDGLLQEVTGGHFGKAKPQIVTKTWGREEIFINTELYCMKALYFNPGQGTSVHFHCSKHETFFVSKGVITLKLYNRGVARETLLFEGDSFVVPPGLVHSIHSYNEEEACLIEASTFSRDEDSNRLDLVEE